ncbi:MAG: hypothetical protein E6Q97_05070 [Desulfurellales bacterium]|nr:MAG: hypothetical protein E6Q97_05070 [Desulfurellales bacterium]
MGESMRADIREENERDRRLRERRQADGLVDLRSNVVVHWPCKNDRCRKPVEVTEACAGRLASFNDLLRAKREPTINTANVVYCDTCEGYKRERLQAVLSQRASETTKLIQELKAGANWQRQDEIYKRLEELRHPDLPGLRQAMAEKANGKSTTNKKGRL